MKIILGSTSPRRKGLLEEIFKKFIVMPSNFEEEKIKETEKNPAKLVENLAKCKGEEIFSRLNEKDYILISADTMVFCNNKLLGKPKSEKEAFEMLKLLQGNVHTVYTGMYIIINNNEKLEKILTHSKADVYFKKLTDNEILEYIKIENTLDKAGGYAIQGPAGKFVEKIEGNYNTIVGLDTKKLENILKDYIK